MDYRDIIASNPQGWDKFIQDILTPRPAMDLSNYRRYFQLYDRFHEPKLGPEPTKQQLLEAAEVLTREGKPYAEALREAALTVSN